MEPNSSDIQSGYDKAAAAYAQTFIDEQAKKTHGPRNAAAFC